MDAKTYRVKNMRQALELIRRELGPEASVLHSRRVRRSGVGGWLTGQTELEVVASSSVDVPSRFPSGDEPKELPTRNERANKPVPQSKVDLDHSPAKTTPPPSATLFEPTTSLPLSQARAIEAVRGRLTDAGFGMAQVEQAIAALQADRFDFSDAPHDEAVQETLIEIADLCQIGGPLKWQAGHSHWVALVGPTGVGKTTTIAKLAAGFAKTTGLSVGLVTVDTARLGGSDHLAAYADVFQLPLEVIDSPLEMERLGPQLTEQHDLVLIDTGGYSPRQAQAAQRLQEILTVARPDEIQLVISGAMSTSSIAASYEQFATMGLTGSILTKLDETPALAEVWPALQDLSLPVNYLTHGQRVPEDVTPASLEQFAMWLKRTLAWPESLELGEGGQSRQVA